VNLDQVANYVILMLFHIKLVLINLRLQSVSRVIILLKKLITIITLPFMFLAAKITKTKSIIMT
jgi:hypothetical protein